MRVLVLVVAGLAVVIVGGFLLMSRPAPAPAPDLAELEHYLFTGRVGPGGSRTGFRMPDFDATHEAVRDLIREAVARPVNESRRLALSLAADRDWPWLVDVVGKALLDPESGLVRRDVPESLLDSPEMAPYVSRGLRSRDLRVRREAAVGAGRLRLADEVPFLVSYVRSDDAELRRAVGEALARIGTAEAFAPLIDDYLSSSDGSGLVSGFTAQWISKAEPEALDLLLARYDAAPDRSSVRHRALPLLRASRSRPALERLRDDGLRSEWSRARYHAYLALVDLEEVETLRALARDPASPHRAPAAWGLAVLGREEEEDVEFLKSEIEREIRAGESRLFSTPGGDHGLVIPLGMRPECHLETAAALRTGSDLFAWLEGLLDLRPPRARREIRTRILGAMAARDPGRAEPRLRAALEEFDPRRDDADLTGFLVALDGIRLLATREPETTARLRALLEILPDPNGREGFPARAIRTILAGEPTAHAFEMVSWGEADRLRFRQQFMRLRRSGGAGLSYREAEDAAFDEVRGRIERRRGS